MTLQELEEKLAKSCENLRSENQMLIKLLQAKQNHLIGNVTSTNITTRKYGVDRDNNDEQQYLNNSSGFAKDISVSSDNNPNDNTDVVLCKSKTSDRERARELLAGLRQSFRSVQFDSGCESVEQYDKGFTADNDDHGRKTIPKLIPKSTPKSILKRRRIIEDNVHVKSMFEHTPVKHQLPGNHIDLNFSYSDDDTEDYYPSAPPGGSYIEENNLTQNNIISQRLNENRTNRELDDKIRKIERIMGQKLLEDPGNDRQHANIIKTIEQRPANPLFDRSETETEENTSNNRPLEYFSREGRPLLGYDWIAGNLENEGLFEECDGLFNEIEEFRRNNREDCIGTDSVWDGNPDLRRPISPEIEDPGHTCIHTYGINDRLFTQSINQNEEGKSICPVCFLDRKTPTEHEPAFVRVSIPKAALSEPYQIKPHTRKSFDPSDSYALSRHCLAGWQNVKPISLPTAGTVDIKDKVMPKETTTYEEARKIAEEFSKMGQFLQGKDNEDTSALSQEFATRNRCLRYELDNTTDFGPYTKVYSRV